MRPRPTGCAQRRLCRDEPRLFVYFLLSPFSPLFFHHWRKNLVIIACLSTYFATAARGIEPVTAAELARLGAEQIRPVVGGVHFEGDLRLLYRANLFLRTATRIVRPLREFAAITPEMLYSQTRRVRWKDYLNPEKTLAVYATIQGSGVRVKRDAAEADANPVEHQNASRDNNPGSRGRENRNGPRNGIAHSQYAALKIKDAIVDRLRREQGARPNIDTEDPDIRVQAHFAGGRCTLSLDSSGASLHERGYRLQTTAAPMKETLAAAIIELSGWDGQVPLVDPMCGSGTLVIEAALRALRIPPGLPRESFAFQRWPDYDAELWRDVQQAARTQILPTLSIPIFGSDSDPQAIKAARANATRAGVQHAVRFEIQRAEELVPPAPAPGVLVVNPPYGARLGEEQELQTLYHQLGEAWKQRFSGWTGFVFAGNLKPARHLDLHAVEKFKLYNGALECRLLKFEIP